ncbi:MAG: molybdenum cofactor guanylyltransferase [Corynebacterium sp.]|nr:molybdenum cofactor guanylyltransferase [Corynebacterium sp.]
MVDYSQVVALILAGGRSTRMGEDKAQVRVHGERLIDRLVRQLPAGVIPVVVSPVDLGLACAVVCEEPPYSGPVAGIAAGMAWIARTHPTCSYVVVLAVDAPDSSILVSKLCTTLAAADATVDAITVQAEGYIQPLGVAWRPAALRRALEKVGDHASTPLKGLLRVSTVGTITTTGGAERDYDTPAAIQALHMVAFVPPSKTTEPRDPGCSKNDPGALGTNTGLAEE